MPNLDSKRVCNQASYALFLQKSDRGGVFGLHRPTLYSYHPEGAVYMMPFVQDENYDLSKDTCDGFRPVDRDPTPSPAKTHEEPAGAVDLKCIR